MKEHLWRQALILPTSVTVMRRIAAPSSCLLALLCVVLAFAVAPAHAYKSIDWTENQCWQTGQIGAESHTCENPTASGYLAKHMINNLGGDEPFKKAPGQYCSYTGLNTLGTAEENPWFGVPSPHSSYQEGDGEENVCAAWAPSSEAVEWGLQLNNNPHGQGGHVTSECLDTIPYERCGMQHYFSVATEKEINNRESKDSPWPSYFSYPTLYLYTPAGDDKLLKFQPGESGFGWGYVCPLLEDHSTGDIVELCFEQWYTGGPNSKGPEWRGPGMFVGECRNGYTGFEHSYDKVVDRVSEGFYSMFDESLRESEFPVEYALEGGSHSEIALEGSFMREVAELDNKSTVTKNKEDKWGWNNEPETGSGCGRHSSTAASEWDLIGIANGVEEWEAGEIQAERPTEPEATRHEAGELTATIGPIVAWTTYGEHSIEVSSENIEKTTETQAVVTGEVNPAGKPTDYVVEYGTASLSEHATTEALVGSGSAPTPVSTTLTGLKPSTTYKYRIKAFYSTLGIGYGAEQAFSTLGPPSVETNPATYVSKTEATLHGAVNPRGTETKYYFEYGKTISYGMKTAEASAGSGASYVYEGKSIAGLEKGTTYHFRIVATNAKGTSYGSDQSFTTVPASWLIQSTSNPGKSGNVLVGASCASTTACTAVGFSGSVTLAETWNGSEWKSQTTPNPKGATTSYLNGVSCVSTECFAVGETHIAGAEGSTVLAEAWNGKEWSIQSIPAPSHAESSVLDGISCTSTTACTAVGSYTENAEENIYLPFAERWNGKEWKVQTMPSVKGKKHSVVRGVSCLSSTACTAVGYQDGGPLAEGWNGTEWKIQTTPEPGSGALLTAVSCVSTGVCIAVGEEHSIYVRSFAEEWNGTTWSAQTMPAPKGASWSESNGVSCVSATACVMVGNYYNTESSSTSTQAESWNGKEWTLQSTPNQSEAKESSLIGVSCFTSTNCTAAGWYRTGGGGSLETTLAERYE
jgi:hypothetical protein